MIRYYCQGELLPTIEGALAAHGYHIEVPLQQNAVGARAMVMTCGLTSVLLAQAPDHATLEIEIWGAAQPTVANVLESLPITLHRQSMPANFAREDA
jgi:hypothetical protein